MLQQKEWRGKFILKHNGKNRNFQGVLTYDPKDGCELRVTKSTLYSDELSMTFDLGNIDIIKGIVDTTGKKLTLLNSHISHSSLTKGIILKIHVGLIVEDITYTNAKSLLFSEATIEFSGIGSWMNISGVDRKINDDGQRFVGTTLSYIQPGNIVFDLNKDLRLIFSFGFSSDKNTASETSHHINEHYYTSLITKNAPLDIYEFLNRIEDCRRLFMVLYNQPCFITSLKVRKNTSGTVFSDCPIYYKNSTEGFPDKFPKGHRMLFRYNQLNERFGQILSRWLNYRQFNDLHYVAWIVAGKFGTFSEETFLQVARALEVFHRSTRKNPICSDVEKERLKKAVLNYVSIEHFLAPEQLENGASEIDKERFQDVLDKITGSLNYMNDPTLRWRLKSMYAELKRNVSEGLFNQLFPDKKKLFEQIGSNRNYYTHYDEESKKSIQGEALPIGQLYQITNRARNILIIFLLHDLGLSFEEVASRIVKIG